MPSVRRRHFGAATYRCRSFGSGSFWSLSFGCLSNRFTLKLSIDQNLIGKESKCRKYETLRILLAELGAGTTIWFVEDRLKTLLSVQKQLDLKEVELFLADWGYNTQKERDSVAQYPPIHLLSSAQFCQDFSKWKN